MDDPSDRVGKRPSVNQETGNKIVLIKEQMLAVQSPQKSYADKRRRPLEFEVGVHVWLRVSPT